MGETSLTIYETFVKDVRAAFGYLDPRATAEWKLQNLSLRNRPCFIYLSEFQSIIPRLKYNDESMIEIFKKGLEEKIWELLANEEKEDKTFDTVTKVCIMHYSRWLAV